MRGAFPGALFVMFALGLLCLQQLGPLAGSSANAAPPNAGPLANTLLVHVVRTGPTEANVAGIALTPIDVVEVLVDGSVVATGAPLWNLDYWFFHLPVATGSTVQTRIGILTSPAIPVPAFVPQPMGLPGFIYAQGTSLMRNGAPIQLFGPDEATAFIFALDASGLWGGPPAPGSWGNNQLFPSGPGANIPGATDLDSHWREFFRYFLHYQQIAGQPGHPKPNLIRIWVAAQNWRAEGTYLAWKQNPTAFWSVFDRMVYWAKQANVYIVPVLGHSESGNPQTVYFDTTSAAYAHQLEVARAIMTRYDNEPQIAMWDLWNEADVNNGAYWNPIGGVNAYRAWATALIADLRPYSTHHLFTLGHGVTSAEYFFNNGPGFSIQRHFVFNDIPGLDVSHDHTYMTAEDQYMIDWQAAWHEALGKPHFTGEIGYNQYPGPSPYGYGYWPWFVQQAGAAGFAALSPMVFWNNGRGVYADYAYTGPLPQYGTSSFDFSVSLNPTSAAVSPGQSTTTTVTAALTAGTAQAVNLSASGVPSGASGSFSVTTCSPTCTSTLTISTAVATPTGAYSITVTASGGGVSRTAPFALTVNAPCPTVPGSYPTTSWDRVWCDSALVLKLADAPDEPVEKFDNNWGRGVVAGIRADDLGFRSGRTINIPTAGDYQFAAGADDGVRVWIDGTSFIDKWFQEAYTVYNFTVTLTAGSHQVRLDYYEGPGDARVSFTYAQVTPPDVTPPARVTNLNATSTGTQSISLRWTAPGDDGATGTASIYDLRSSSAGPIDDTNFLLATRILTGVPGISGTPESMSVTGLSTGTRYWFGLRTADEVPNWSPTSNVADAVTQSPPPDTTPPARVMDLNATAPGSQTAILRWTAPGDDGSTGRATSYDARYSTAGPLTDANFATATPFATPMPGNPGATESITVSGLTPGTRYWFGVKTADEVPNWSPLSNTATALTSLLPDTTPPVVGFTTPANGSSVSGDVQVTAWATDDVSVASVSFSMDGSPIGTYPTPPYTWAWRTTDVADGAHRLTMVASDTSGNRGSATADVIVRNTSPVPPQVSLAAWDPDHAWVEISFSKPMNRSSVAMNLQTDPITGHSLSWTDDTHLFVVLSGSVTDGQTYQVTIGSPATDAQGVPMAGAFRYEFQPNRRPVSDISWNLLTLLLVVSVTLTIAGLVRTRRRREKLPSARAHHA